MEFTINSIENFSYDELKKIVSYIENEESFQIHNCEEKVKKLIKKR